MSTTSPSTDAAKSLRTVLIVGASYAGATLARELEKKLPPTHRIVLIDASSFAFWPIATLRAAVVPGWESKVFEPLSQAFFSVNDPNTRHVMLAKTRVKELKKTSVIVDRENPEAGFSTEIHFDVCVLAMGSTYRFPMRPSSTNQDKMVAALKESQARIASASNILIVGGGATGIEYAGEIAAHHGKTKTVTLVQSGAGLLNPKYPVKLAGKLKAGLEGLGVRIILNERVGQDLIDAGKGSFTTMTTEVIEADLILGAGGTTANTSLVSDLDRSAVDEHGFIKVDQYLQIKSNGDSSPLKNGVYFAAGDCCNSPGGPTGLKAANDAGVAAKNIIASLTGGKMKAIGAPLPAFIVPIGMNGGAALLPVIGVLGGWTASTIKGKTLFCSNFEAMYRPQK